ncbi:serine hydrolase [soil metagenome]
MATQFEQRYGFARSDVTLATWRKSPYSRWSFQNVREAVPDMQISCAGERAEDAPVSPDALLSETIRIGDKNETVGAFLKRSDTDLLVAMKGGRFVADYVAPYADPDRPHILFSISKSITGLLAGILAEMGVIDLDAPVIDYVPDAKGGAFDGATIRHLLDMRVSLAFEESYLNQDGDYARYRRATLWNPAIPGQPQESLREFLLSLHQAPAPHGGAFYYQSPNSDFLGVLLEEAAGIRFADLVSELIWQPLGARKHGAVSVDRAGTARVAGGISVTVRDLARLGEMLRRGGTVGDGRRIAPSGWLHDMMTAGDAKAWAAGDLNLLIPGGRYRSKWYQTGDGAFCGIGIHGQWLYVDPERETVIVKLSSQPLPQDDALDLEVITFLRALSPHL